MEQNITAKLSKGPLSRLVELPIELLVYIFSLLPTSRDIVRLRYVSRKIRSISETSTLWKNFLWPWYDSREETSVNEVLKTCGTHIKRLTFPGDFSAAMRACWHGTVNSNGIPAALL